MSKTILLSSLKGGVGKTTVCAALAFALAYQSKRVLCVDLDSGVRALDLVLGAQDLSGRDVHLYRPRGGVSHEMDFIDAVYSGGRTACPCSVGHRSITIAHVANICERLGLSSLKWDPVAERFPDNAEANKLAVVSHDNGWVL